MSACQVTGFYIRISTRKKNHMTHPPSVVLHVQYDGFIFFAVYSLMYRSVWMWTAFLHFEAKCICGKAAFSHRTHNWLIYWVLCISVRTCLCVWESLVHYASLWSVMSGCHCLLLIMDDCYDARIHIRMYQDTHTQIYVSNINFMMQM